MIELVGIAIHTKKRSSMKSLERISVGKDWGLAGDVYARSGTKRQVVVVSCESWNEACEVLGREVDWTVRRANLLISGKKFGPDDVGKRLCLGDVTLLITGECKPCSRMDGQETGLTVALTPEWRGGVTCVVLRGGEVRVGGGVSLLDRSPSLDPP